MLSVKGSGLWMGIGFGFGDPSCGCLALEN
jgi:hypothetical protein